ncbi:MULTISPECIES: hypothetical protein [unclassified Streptomyces]|nr:MULTISPECIES: hypothetical protein [unclassified Streptomyces]MCX5054529.1 hypothetical protein [Streptomyces sp. NBC_00474]
MVDTIGPLPGLTQQHNLSGYPPVHGAALRPSFAQLPYSPM